MSEPNPGRPEAAAVVWSPEGIDPGPGETARRRAARRRGLVQVAVAASASGLIFWLWSERMAVVVACVALVFLACSQLSPLRAYAAIERGFAALGRWTGAALTLVIMTVLFYGVFLPFGLLFRRGARDPMKRRYDEEAESYWEDREPMLEGGHQRQY